MPVNNGKYYYSEIGEIWSLGRTEMCSLFLDKATAMYEHSPDEKIKNTLTCKAIFCSEYVLDKCSHVLFFNYFSFTGQDYVDRQYLLF
jgi:hypothetical protein